VILLLLFQVGIAVVDRQELEAHIGEALHGNIELTERLARLLLDDGLISNEKREGDLEAERLDGLKDSDVREERRVRAALDIQRHLAGLDDHPRSDELNEEDLDLLLQPRCGNPEIDKFSLPMDMRESLPRRQVERGWNKRRLSVRFNPIFPNIGIPRDDAYNAVAGAMATWNAANVGTQFYPTRFLNSDIFVSWWSPNQDPERYLRPGTRYAHGDFPPPDNNQFGPPPLPICFSTAERWSVDGSLAYFDIESVALHEFGHCIGLFHRGIGSIMYKSIRRGEQRRRIDFETINAARALYIAGTA
jgi:hypothetical protein